MSTRAPLARAGTPLYRPVPEAPAADATAFHYPRLVRTQFRLPAPTSPFHQAVLAYEREQRRGRRFVCGAASGLVAAFVLGCFFLGRWTADPVAASTPPVVNAAPGLEVSARMRALEATNTRLKLDLVAAEATKERLGRAIVASIFEAREAGLAADARRTPAPPPGHDD